ncbi:MAG: peptidylprolyl isomerase, partial [Spirochaetales bacterium]|nr:peptidylprolyl isomerase [Spirochaetales bacterium]
MRMIRANALMSAVMMIFFVMPVTADPTASLPDGLYASISTSRGNIVLELYEDKAPLAVTSFVGLAEGTLSASGKPYFDGVTFHRVEPGFVIQGGDPTGTGRGGPGYAFPNETLPELGFGTAGVLGMANSGPDTNGSQFFITLAPASFLDGSYTVFGKVVSGMDAVMAIRKGDAMTSVRIVRKGPAAQALKADRSTFDAGIKAHAAGAARRAKEALEAQYSQIRGKTPGLATDADGLQYKILTKGNGKKPAPGSRVRILYTLSLANGKKLDSTADRAGEPFAFILGGGRVIPGFDAAVAAMSYGERRLVVIPPELGYGAAGAGGVVPPNAV